MKDLYLRSVELSNFRIYGDSYAYEFPAGPGVALITGANGMGKTSFFDGVEWALTGRVSRFSDIRVDGRRKEIDPLTRIGAPHDSHRVSLQFTDGSPIDRGRGFIPDDERLTRLLKREDWPDIRNLHGYLSITHFLGQAATRRFSLREPKDQWEALKGPAGVDRINALRERMSGHGARLAFTRAIKDRTQLLERSHEALQKWVQLLDERDRARKLASSERPLPPGAVSQQLDALAEELVPLVQGLAWTASVVGDEPELSIDRFAEFVHSVQRLFERELGQTDSLDRLARAFEASQSESSALKTLAEDVAARRKQTVDALSLAESTLSEASAALEGIQRTAADEQQRSVILERAIRAAAQVSSAEGRLTEYQRQLEMSDRSVEQVRSKLSDLHKAVVETTALRAERGATAEAISLARKRAQISAALQSLRIEIRRLEPIGAEQSATDLRAMREVEMADAVRATTEVTTLNARLRHHDERVRELSEAVSAIVHRLTHDDTRCPVCATQFPPGRLLEVSKSQESADATPVGELAGALVDARFRADAIARRIVEIDRKMAEHDQLLATLAEHREREAALQQQLVEYGGTPDGIYTEAEIALLQQGLNALDQKLIAGRSVEDLQTLVTEAEATLSAEAAKRLSVERERTSASESIAASRSMLMLHPELWSTKSGLLIDPSQEQARAERRTSALGIQLAAAQRQADDARASRDIHAQSLSRDTEALESANRQLDAAASSRKELARKWTEAGESGEPSVARLTQIRARHEERNTRLESLRTQHSIVVAGYKAWLNDQVLSGREQQIEEIVKSDGAGSESAVTLALETKIVEAQRALELAQAARNRMESVGRLMQERADAFTGDVLAPLNSTIRKFARTLMTWSDASIIYHAEHHTTRSELRPRILRTEVDGSTTQLEMNPNLYFSEGQLSALSVSALLAASTTFNWSRWRGLLLDDPLQHNDVIHASAFMDLLRKMVRDLGYQVILSTHDSAEADFLVRKCRSAGISYVVHELTPRGEEGLITAVA